MTSMTEQLERPLPNEGPQLRSRTDMVLLRPHAFCMGADDGSEAEQPRHEVALSPFWIDATPVTNAEFARFVAATGHVTKAELAGTGWALDAQSYRMVPGVSWRTSPLTHVGTTR